MLKEVLVVEGKMDTVAIRRALEADTIETGGFTLLHPGQKRSKNPFGYSPIHIAGGNGKTFFDFINPQT